MEIKALLVEANNLDTVKEIPINDTIEQYTQLLDTERWRVRFKQIETDLRVYYSRDKSGKGIRYKNYNFYGNVIFVGWDILKRKPKDITKRQLDMLKDFYSTKE